MMLDPIKAGWLLKKYLFLLIDWPLLKFPLWGEIPGVRQTPICPKKIQSGSRWLNASNSNSLSYLQVYPPLTTPFLPPQAIQYISIWIILNLLHSFLHHQVKLYHKFLHLSSFFLYCCPSPSQNHLSLGLLNWLLLNFLASSHACLQYVLHKECVLVAQSCLNLCNPMGYSPPDCSVHEISQARILE